MRTIRLTFVLVVAFAALAMLAASAAAIAGPGPRKPSPTVRTQTTTPVPASTIVPKTAAMLAGSTYPWVQPHWVRVDGVLLPTVPRTIRLSTTTQPPAWIHIG